MTLLISLLTPPFVAQANGEQVLILKPGTFGDKPFTVNENEIGTDLDTGLYLSGIEPFKMEVKDTTKPFTIKDFSLICDSNEDACTAGSSTISGQPQKITFEAIKIDDTKISQTLILTSEGGNAVTDVVNEQDPTRTGKMPGTAGEGLKNLLDFSAFTQLKSLKVSISEGGNMPPASAYTLHSMTYTLGSTPAPTPVLTDLKLQDADTSTDIAYGFASGTQTYQVSVNHAVSAVKVTPVSAGATITVDGQTVASGTSSSSIPLTPGLPRKVIVKVAPDREYEVTITRQTRQQTKPSFTQDTLTRKVTITAPDGGEIYYTIDGTTPLEQPAQRYTAPVDMTAGGTIKAIAAKQDWITSDVATETYGQAESALLGMTISGNPTAFVFTPQTKAYTMTVAHEVATVTVTPTAPVNSVIKIEEGGQDVAQGAAIALVPGVAKVITVTVTEPQKKAVSYTVTITRQQAKQAKPTFQPAAGVIPFTQLVEVTAPDGGDIYYTVDGTTPATTVSGTTKLYDASQKIALDETKESVTVKAIAVKANDVASDVASATYEKAVTEDATSIALSGQPQGYTALTAGKYEYANITVANAVESITVTPTSSVPATITVGLDVVSNGQSSTAIALLPGQEKTITVTLKAVGKKAKTYTFKVTREQLKQAKPTFSVASGPVAFGTQVTLQVAEQDATIYYTLDGTTPTETSAKYTAPLTISQAGTMKAIAVRTGWITSDVAEASYTQAESRLTNITLSGSPTNFTFAAETFTYPNVAVKHEVDKVTITPSPTATIEVDGQSSTGNDVPLTPGVERTVTVTVTEQGKKPKVYTIKVTREQLKQAKPTFSVASGPVAFGTQVTLQVAEQDATIYYTLDGTTPTETSAKYTAPLTISQAGTLKAIAVRTGWITSDVAEASYTQAESRLTTITLSGSPTNFTFAAETFTYPNVAVKHEVDKVTITPSPTATIEVDGQSSTGIDVPLTPGVERTVTVTVTEQGKKPKVYTMNVTRARAKQATPTFSPAAGEIAYGDTVTIQAKDATAIYYTTDGTTPTTSSTMYTTPIPIHADTTIRALAIRDHYEQSDVATAAYTQATSEPLTALTLSGQPANYTFVPTKMVYENVTVKSTVETVTVTPTGAGTITVEGTTVSSGTASTPIALTINVEKPITVVYTQQGKKPRTYVLHVKRTKSNDATLKTLKVNDGQLPLSFRPDTTRYTIDVPTTVTKLQVAATAAPDATIVYKVGTAVVTQPIPINANMTITVEVTAADGVTKQTYLIDVRRAQPPIIVPDVPVIVPDVPISVPGDSNVRQVKVITDDVTRPVAQVPVVRERRNELVVDYVAVNEEKMNEVVAKAVINAQSQITIVVDDLPTQVADEVDVQLDRRSVSGLQQAKLGLVIEALGARITLPAASLQQLDRDLYFKVVPIRKASAQQEVKERATAADEVKRYANGRTYAALGQPMTIETNYSNHVTKVMFPIDSLVIPTNAAQQEAYFRHLALFIEHTDGERKVQQGTVIRNQRGEPIGYEIEIPKFSTFTFVTIDNQAPMVRDVTTTVTAAGWQASYTYVDAENDREGSSSFAWYRADDAKGTNRQLISTAPTYKPQRADIGKYIAVAIQPRALTGTKDGALVMSPWRGPVCSGEGCVAIQRQVPIYEWTKGKLVQAGSLSAGTHHAVTAYLPTLYRLENGVYYVAKAKQMTYETPSKGLLAQVARGVQVKWKGQTLSKGQTGRLLLQADTTMFMWNGQKRIMERSIKAGTVHRIFGTQPAVYLLDNGYYVIDNEAIHYYQSIGQ